jgi:hypothetical protein
VGLTCSIAAWLAYGEGDYSKFRPSGKFRVGFRDFKSKELGNDCSIFYPAASDASGDFSVPFLPYGQKHIEAFQQIAGLHYPAFSFLLRFITGSYLSFRIPVYRNANLGLDEMQPIIFSHGLTAQRLTYSAMFMELASCGYCVISITHND